jgi:hypothetical protein
MKQYTFPQYRKNKQGTSYFKILSNEAFIEWQIIGAKKWEHHVKARQFPEKLLIQDMLACRNGLWQVISENEFLSACSPKEK